MSSENPVPSLASDLLLRDKPDLEHFVLFAGNVGFFLQIEENKIYMHIFLFIEII